MVSSALTSRDGHWSMSRFYVRMDPTEKGALSYFLGMAMAKVAATELLGVHHLVHLDTFLEAGGLPRSGRRPDFLGLSRNREVIAAIESKGRSDLLTANAVLKAKAQSHSIPTPLGLPALSVASLAWFDTDGRWCSTLVDPPEKHPTLDGDVEGLLRSYYLPIIDAGVQSGTWVDTGELATFSLPYVDLRVVLPGALVDALRSGDSIIEAVAFAARSELHYEGASDDDVYTGPDSIAVVLGETAAENWETMRWERRIEDDLS